MSARPQRRSAAHMQAQCDAFNAKHSVGDTIRVWLGAVNANPPIEVAIVEPGAFVFGGHTPCVQTAGKGCVALTHVMREAGRG